MSTAQDLKEKGSKAHREGKYDEAIQFWSEAVALSQSNNNGTKNKELLKILFSNRSATYSIQKKYALALSDSEQCISLDSTWSKGYVRKGDALYALGRFTDAFNAYNNGLRNAPPEEKASIQKKCEQAMRMIRGQDNDQSSGTSSNYRSTGNPYFNNFQSLMRVCIFISLFAYILPFGHGMSLMAARFLSVCAIIVRASVIYQKFGIPKFSMDYATRALSDPAGIGLFLGMLMLMSGKPYFLVLLSVSLAEASYFADTIGQYGRSNLPLIQQNLGPLIEKYGQAMLRGSDPLRFLNYLCSVENSKAMQSQLISASAYCEVLQGLFVIAELLLPSRNLMFAMLWWQFLQMRYMVDQSGAVKSAFRSVDMQIVGMLSIKLCPPMLMTIYIQIRGYLEKRVQPDGGMDRGVGGGLGSMMSKCTIM